MGVLKADLDILMKCLKSKSKVNKAKSQSFLCFVLDMLEKYCFFSIQQNGKCKWSLFTAKDGAPPHHKTIVCDMLNVKFPNRWTGRDGSMAGPLDLTICDYFGELRQKHTLFAKIQNLAHRRERSTL